ncbi:MAG: glycoside hydrolase family 95 protein, partial [Prevotella sp.]|nr:glycoside hydrolase family 95 protein [Prevotella sp.]
MMFCCGTLGAAASVQPSASASALRLNYDKPAAFFEESLVIGNGRLGAIVYGGTHKDRISLNDITLWTGEPDKTVYSPDAHQAIPEIRAALDREDYRTADKLQRKVQGHYSENYQPLGTLTISYLDRSGRITDYRRWLDISDATAATTYK